MIASRAAVTPPGPNGTTNPQSAWVTSSAGSGSGVVITGSARAMYSWTFVGIDTRKFASSCSSDRPARAPSVRDSASSFGTKPCQRTASPPASMWARACASAEPISSTEIPRGASSRPSDTISADPRSGEISPTYTTRRGPDGGAAASGTNVVFGTTGWSWTKRAL
jgi:hypothetical protein